jgi:hypothetical protein
MERMPCFRLLALTGAALLATGIFTPVRAQDPDDLKRGVARISLMNGEVSVRRGDSGDWVAGAVNAPLLTADRIATGPNSRAEVQFDSANMLRIGGNAEIHLTQLENLRYQLEIARGTVTFRVLRASDANVEVDTPSVSVRPSRQGTYRINVKEAGETEITSRAGDVEVFTPKGSQWVSAGQTMLARGTASDPEFQIVAAIASDDWDRWNDSRDGVLTRSTSNRYVGQGVYGAEDLDPYGTWGNDPDYGNVWRPTVAAGWAPYQSGRWVWEDWYGWTWVSYDPWGWAPYHYGRWSWQTGFGWGWYPGRMGMRHYWSPALVGFFGFGGGGMGFGFGNIGWVPLAPYEMFHPWWGRGFSGGRTYMNRSMNITNGNLTNVYRNARVANGISGVNGADFRAGRFNNIGHFSGNQIGQASLVHGAMPISPSSANLRFSDRAVTNTPRSSGNTHFFTQQQPSPVARTPLAGQQRSSGAAVPERAATGARGAGQAAAQNGLRSPQSQAGTTPRASQSGAAGGWRQYGNSSAPNAGPSQARSSNPATAQPNRGGWQKFGEPGGSQSAPRSQPSPQNNRGWTGFGNPGSSSGSARQQYAQPSRSEYRGSPSYSAPQSSRPQSLGVAPPVVRERSSGGSYSAPRSYSGGGGSYSAPRSYSGGGGGSSRPSGGGGGSHSSGGGSSRGGHR